MVIRTLISVVSTVFYLFELLIFARCILSFLPVYNQFTQWVYKLTEPFLAPCRRLIGRFNFNLPLDFSPIVLLLIMQFVQRLIMNILVGFLY